MGHNERPYKVSDAEFIEYAERLHKSLPEYLNQFKAFDSTIQANYTEALRASIDAVLNMKSDQVVIDEQAELTENVLKAVDTAVKDFMAISYFIKKAYPKNKAKQNQFGLNDFRTARKSQSRLILFMNSFVKQVKEHEADLLAVGCSQNMLNALPGHANALVSTNTLQESYKKKRGVLTQGRVEALAHLYKMLLPISEISGIIFAEDEALLHTFSMPMRKQVVREMEEESVEENAEE